jgi:hypothetical protein
MLEVCALSESEEKQESEQERHQKTFKETLAMTEDVRPAKEKKAEKEEN